METTRGEIEEAAKRIEGLVRTTPILELEPGFFLKLEQLQVTGSFKVRGAFSFLTAHPEVEHVVAASGGNHGLAVAHAASRLGRRADIFCPSTSPQVKLDRIREAGATLHVVDGYYDAALEASRSFLKHAEAVELHAFDAPEVVAGQGTCGREITTQLPGVAEVVVAVGGGGLIGGIASWVREQTHVVAAETHNTSALYAALTRGAPVDVEVGGISADSLGAARVGELAFEAASRWVDETALVTDEEVADARHWLWDQSRLVVEPGAATALAVARDRRRRRVALEPLCVVLSGANTDPASVA